MFDRSKIRLSQEHCHYKYWKMWEYHGFQLNQRSNTAHECQLPAKRNEHAAKQFYVSLGVRILFKFIGCLDEALRYTLVGAEMVLFTHFIPFLLSIRALIYGRMIGTACVTDARLINNNSIGIRWLCSGRLRSIPLSVVVLSVGREVVPGE